MNPFETLPDEILLNMCGKMDTPQLLNMAQSYSRIYQVCNEVISMRKKGEEDIRKIIKGIVKERGIYYHHSGAFGYPDQILLTKSMTISNEYELFQFGFPSFEPWVLQGWKDYTIVNESKYAKLDGIEELRKALQMMKKANYIRGSYEESDYY